ncbi:MAG: nucleotidyl transferase AbiEii/AbiGii toxin family protein [Akkermansiaceae bacterium]
MIQDRLADYACRSALEEELALREITQEVVLAALGRTDFFARAAFQGGTCLRIFHGLPRFSEDLDFALAGSDPGFQLSPYLEAVSAELTAYGYGLEIDNRDRVGPVQMGFLKDDSLGRVLRLAYRPTTGPSRKIRIKLEVDTNPPAGARYDMPVMDFPFPSAIRIFDPPSLLAGKIHALLCREYTKGRDWFDFIWYAARKITINHDLLTSALDQLGPWAERGVTADNAWCGRELEAAIGRLNIERAREDVRRFLKPADVRSLELWDRDFLLAQNRKLTGCSG